MVKPIFIIGVPRSGTTLLRVILDSHSRIVAAPETPWILGSYGPGSIRELVCTLTEHETGPVKNLAGVTSELVHSAALEFFNKIIGSYLYAKQKDLVVLKTPDDIQYLEFLIKLFPNSTYIHMFRDGRDVACSTVNKRATFFGNKLRNCGELNFENAMRRWYDWESKTRQFLGANKNLKQISISYEDLVAHPRDTIKKTCGVLNVNFEETMLEYYLHDHDYPEWEAGSTDVKNKAGIDEKSIGRWTTEISKQDLRNIEGKYGNFLKELGYTLMTNELNVRNDITPAEDRGLKRLIGFAINYCKRLVKYHKHTNS